MATDMHLIRKVFAWLFVALSVAIYASKEYLLHVHGRHHFSIEIALGLSVAIAIGLFNDPDNR